MVVKLIDLYNTKYFYISICKDLTYLFSSCWQIRNNTSLQMHAGNEKIAKVFDCFRTGAPVQFDLAGGKYTSDACAVIQNAQREYGIQFIDTECEWREQLFRENDERLQYAKSVVDTTTPLPILERGEPTIDYIKSLQKGIIYSVPFNYPGNIWMQVVTLINIYRPSIQLYLQNRELQLLSFIAKQLIPEDLNRFEEYYMITPQGVQKVRRGEKIYVQQLGYTDVAGALTVADFVPTDFGSVPLKDDVTFRVIATNCIHEVNKYHNTRAAKLSELF